MTRLGRNFYSATPGEVIRITVRSVNFVINANLDPKLAPVGPVNDFSKAGELTMGNTDTVFAIDYNFPNPMPQGGKYTATVSSGDFTDGPNDILQVGAEPTETLAYVVKFAAPALAGGAGQGQP
jgi:hypothetical protein